MREMKTMLGYTLVKYMNITNMNVFLKRFPCYICIQANHCLKNECNIRNQN